MSISLDDQLVEAASLGDLGAVRNLLELGADATAVYSKALRSAAEKGHARCVQLLMAVSDPLARNSEALLLAARHGHPECVRLLMPVSDPSAYQYQALRYAAFESHLECVKLLLPVSEVKAESSEALRHAAIYGQVDCLTLLISAGSRQPNGHADNNNALMWAIRKGQTACARLLMPISDFKNNASDVSEALAEAAEHGHVECVQMLLALGHPHANNREALRQAVFHGRMACVALLLAASDEDKVMMDGGALVRRARGNGHMDVAGMIESFLEKKALESTHVASRADAPSSSKPRL